MVDLWISEPSLDPPLILDKRLKTDSINILWNVVLQLNICDFLAQMSEFAFWVAGWVLAISSKHLVSYVLSRSATRAFTF